MACCMATSTNRLKETRRAQRLDQKALAAKAGVTQQAVSKLERNDPIPRAPWSDAAVKVAEALGVTCEALFDGDEYSWVADPLARSLIRNATFEHDHANSSRVAEGVS